MREQSLNKALISAAGSGKTTYLVDESMRNPTQKILLTTYTNENLNEIHKLFIEKIGYIPENITIKSWFRFLLSECVRPYQNFVYDKYRIESICFVQGRSAKFVKKKEVDKYFFRDLKYIYTDKISEFACNCNLKSNGLVLTRLNDIYDAIYIDEIQDLAGYDFDLLELLLIEGLNTIIVGDIRQSTFSTNQSAKYKKFRGRNILDLFKLWEEQGKCSIEYKTISHRCNQEICNLADSLYPDLPSTESNNRVKTGHDGVFIIAEESLNKYIKEFRPMILRYDKRTNIDDLFMLNFGASKGLSFDRVLIIPNNPIRKYLKTGELVHILKSREKIYVAITRARYSVCFVHDDTFANSKITKICF